MAETKKIIRTLVGKVESNKMDKTVTVRVERTVIHPVYKKYIRRQAKYAAHDELNTCSIGDRVVISESRPISKLKRWRVSQIIEKAV